MSVGKTYNAHFFRHKISFPTWKVIFKHSTLRLFFCQCWLWHIQSITICSAELNGFSSARSSSSGTQDPRSNKLFIVPTIFETIPRVLVRQWMAAVIFYLITKKQQRRRGGTKEWGAAALKSAAAADWMSWRDRYLDIEPQICINFWRGTMPNYTLQTSRKKKSKTVQAYF